MLDILKGCKKYNVSSLLIESNFGDGIVAELFKKHLQNTKQAIHIEETRANVRKEDRIIDSLEPVMNQHRLIVDKSVVEWDYSSNPDEAPEKRLLYMLFYQMSRMCREKYAVKHDDRLDALAQGVQYFTEALSISAERQMAQRKLDDWHSLLEDMIDHPQASANHLVFGMNKDQRDKARGLDNGKSVPTWV